MPKLKTGSIDPSPQEDAAINAAIAGDPDARQLNAQWFAKAKPAIEVLPSEMYTKLVV